MLFHVLIIILIASNLLGGSKVKGVVYYVKPTTSCPHSDTHCPSGETCLKLDNYINESSNYLSPDKVNITLYFMCVVHNQTSEKLVDIHDLQTFAMLGVAANETVTIHMPVQSNESLQTYTFTNVSFVRIENVAIIPSTLSPSLLEETPPSLLQTTHISIAMSHLSQHQPSFSIQVKHSFTNVHFKTKYL